MNAMFGHMNAAEVNELISSIVPDVMNFALSELLIN